jgi:23S rRNA (adenine2503-C2)-methyltransferase
MKEELRNYTLEEAERLFEELGDKSYRARQLYTWLYNRNAFSFDEMTNYSKDLRRRLDERFVIDTLTLEERLRSSIDGTEKFLFRTHDGYHIETVLLRNDNSDDGRLTICISSQVGCAMGCTFCATAKLGFKRNLSTGEILEQISRVRRETDLSNNNIVFMGMGEPFMNYDNVLKAADIMNYDFGFHISVRKITISTCGVLPGIERYIREKRLYNLAISLNDSIGDRRAVTMPIERKYPIATIADMLNRRMPASRNRLTLEYVMRKDNISREDAQRIKALFRSSHVKLNLIPLNAADSPDDTPTDAEIDRFVQYCEIMNIPLSIRKSLGRDINGACGQLAGKRAARLNQQEEQRGE